MKTKTMLAIMGVVSASYLMYGQQDSEIVTIPDENFKRALLNQPSINTNGDEEISYGEAKATLKMNVYGKEIKSLKGIEAFINLRELYCSNNQISNLDLSKNVELEELYCSNNHLVILNVSKNENLKRLICYTNKLSELNIDNNTKLEEVDCSFNKIYKLSLGNNPYLRILSLSYNALNYLDLRKNKELEEVKMVNNQLPNLDISNNPKLQILNISENYFTSIDLSKNIFLQEINVSNNQFSYIDLSNNIALKTLDCTDNKLKNLDISKNVQLEKLVCSSNVLESLDISKNINLKELKCTENYWTLKQLNLANTRNIDMILVDVKDNYNLNCIQIDKDFTPNWKWEKDDTASYSSDCKYPTLSVDTIKNTNNIEVLTLVENTLTIIGDKSIKKIELYSSTGQLLKVLLRNNRNISDISTGVYLLKIYTEKGIQTKKIIKR